MQIQSRSFGFTVPCTHRCLVNYCEEIRSYLKKDKNNCLSEEDHNLLSVAKKLLNVPVYEPDEAKISKKVVKIGNGIEITIDKKPPLFVFLDGVYVLKNDFLLLNQEIVTVGSPLGSALLNKARNEKGKFKTKQGKIHTFEVLDILQYKEAKPFFFPKMVA